MGLLGGRPTAWTRAAQLRRRFRDPKLRGSRNVRMMMMMMMMILWHFMAFCGILWLFIFMALTFLNRFWGIWAQKYRAPKGK